MQLGEDRAIGQIAISNATPTQITPGPADFNPARGVRVKNLTGNAIIWIGNANVSATTGYPLDAGESVEVGMSRIGELYALATTNNQKLGFIWV